MIRLQQSLEDVCMDTGENYSIMPSTTHSKMESRSHCWCYQDTFIGCWLVNHHCLLILAGDGGIPIQWCVRTQILSEWPMPPILLHVHMFSHESPPSNLYHKQASNYCTATGRKVGIHWLPSPPPSSAWRMAFLQLWMDALTSSVLAIPFQDGNYVIILGTNPTVIDCIVIMPFVASRSDMIRVNLLYQSCTWNIYSFKLMILKHTIDISNKWKCIRRVNGCM